MHNFLFHAQHITEAIDCIISITGNNETLLNKIGENLDIQRDLISSKSNVIYGDRAVGMQGLMSKLKRKGTMA